MPVTQNPCFIGFCCFQDLSPSFKIETCGPGAATLASNRWSDPEATVGNEAAHRGARRKPSNHCAGKAGMCAFFRTRATGAVGARLSLRPAVQRDKELASLGRKRAAGMLSLTLKLSDIRIRFSPSHCEER